jgi:hypothetical protein
VKGARIEGRLIPLTIGKPRLIMRQHTYAVPAPIPAPIAEARPAGALAICLGSRAEGEASNPEMLASAICLGSRAEGEASNPEMLASASERRRA